MSFLCVVPSQKSTFCCADFGSTIALELDLEQKSKSFQHCSLEQMSTRDLFLEFIALSGSSEVLFVEFP